MAAAVVVTLVVVSPFGPWSFGTFNDGHLPVIGTHERAVVALRDLIPGGASVLTQNNLFPLISSRVGAYVIPGTTFFPPGTSFNATMDNWTSRVDYILVDYLSSPIEAAILLSWPTVVGNYVVIASADGAVLLQRGYGVLSSFIPFIRSLDYTNIWVKDGSLFEDPSAIGGKAVRHGMASGSDFWWGPSLLLPPGAYRVSYRLRVDNPETGPLLQLPVLLHRAELVASPSTSKGTGVHMDFELRWPPGSAIVASSNLTASDVPLSGKYFWTASYFEAKEFGFYDFPGLGASRFSGLWYNEMILEQLAPYGSIAFPIFWTSPGVSA